MAHFLRTHSDAVWNNGGLGGYVTVEADWESLDGKVFEAVNGDLGGVWAPSSPIVVGDVANAASPSLVVTGATLIAYGGRLRTRAGARFVCSPTTYPRLGASHVGRARKILTSCARRLASPGYTWGLVPGSCAIRSIGCTVVDKSGSNNVSGIAIGPKASLVQPSFHLPLDVHDGARFARATLTFRVGSPRSAAPIGMPRFRVVAVDSAGNVFPLKKTADGTGYASPPAPSSGETWYAGGAAQTFVYETDQNNVVDISRFTYEAQVIEEVGATSISPNFPGDAFLSVNADGVLVVEKKVSVHAASTTSISYPPTGLVSIDGHTPAIGYRILLKDQFDATQNGIYIASTGTWVRDGDADQTIDFTPNFIVAVGGDGTQAAMQGSQLGQVWQIDSSNAITFASDGTTTSPIRFRRRKPAGNIYHAVSCDFDSIADLRFP